MKSYFRYAIALSVVIPLVIIVSRSLNQDNANYTEWFRKSNKQHLTSPLSEILDSSCKTNRLPESISKLNTMYDNVETFVIFLGYSQTVDGLIGNLLDAHSQVLLPQEYDVIGNLKIYKDKKLKEFGQQKHMLFFFMHYLSTFQSIFGNFANKPNQFWLWKSKAKSIKHTYVPRSWQGQTQGKLKVVGYSSGVVTSRRFLNNHRNISVFNEIQSIVGIPVKFLHIITNPFENIAARITGEFSQENGVNRFNSAANDTLSLMDANEQIRQLYGNALLDIHAHELFLNPDKILKQVCNFLDIICNASYIDKVKCHLERFSSRSSKDIELSKEERELIKSKIKKYHFLEPYLGSYTH